MGLTDPHNMLMAYMEFGRYSPYSICKDYFLWAEPEKKQNWDISLNPAEKLPQGAMTLKSQQ